MNLKFKRGFRYAIVGHSGCGKSTIIKLLNLFYTPQEGSIYINDINISRFHINEVRSKIAVVTQENQLFKDSIWNNISYGHNVCSKEDMDNVTKLMGINECLLEELNECEGQIGENEINLSLGQKQRIALARAVLKNADVIVLDEATSGLDSESENAIFNGLCEKYNDKIVIITSHRLSTVNFADEIICMAEGRIVEQGTYSTLMNKKGVFVNLFKSQLKYN